MSLLEKLKAGKANKKLLKFPGTKEDVLMRVLNAQEILDASFAVETLFKQSGIDLTMTSSDVHADEKTTQLLFRSLRDPQDESKQVAKDINEFRACISRMEKNALVDEYKAFEKDCSPNPMEMTQEDFDAFVEDLKKNPEETAGSVSSIATARKLIISLVSQLTKLQKDNGSTST